MSSICLTLDGMLSYSRFRGGDWFWVPVLGPHIGAIFGALLYNICVGLHWPDPVPVDRYS